MKCARKGTLAECRWDTLNVKLCMISINSKRTMLPQWMLTCGSTGADRG